MAGNKRSNHPEIALAIRVGVPHLGRVAQGIRDFSEAQTKWRFLISPETHDLPPASLQGWRGDGVIAQCNTIEEERILSGLNCPVVNISGALRESKFPRVRNDYRQIGQRAAEFLRERGFRRFGFYGVKDVWYSKQIESGFSDAIAGFGFEVATLLSSSTMAAVPRWDDGQDELEDWLRGQKPPFAIMAAHDPRAAMVIRACERVGLKVPADVAVIGVNDDTATCETCRPTLTSIRRNGSEVGRRAAEMLHQLIRGEAVADEVIVPAGAVRERDSTVTLAIDHPALVAAVDFVQGHFREAVGVGHIVDASGQSRRWLEGAFRRELDCSPSEFLRRTRVDAAVECLQTRRQIAIGLLADECGFSGTRQLNTAFRKELGTTVKRVQRSIAAQR